MGRLRGGWGVQEVVHEAARAVLCCAGSREVSRRDREALLEDGPELRGHAGSVGAVVGGVGRCEAVGHEHLHA